MISAFDQANQRLRAQRCQLRHNWGALRAIKEWVDEIDGVKPENIVKVEVSSYSKKDGLSPIVLVYKKTKDSLNIQDFSKILFVLSKGEKQVKWKLNKPNNSGSFFAYGISCCLANITIWPYEL